MFQKKLRFADALIEAGGKAIVLYVILAFLYRLFVVGVTLTVVLQNTKTF